MLFYIIINPIGQFGVAISFILGLNEKIETRMRNTELKYIFIFSPIMLCYILINLFRKCRDSISNILRLNVLCQTECGFQVYRDLEYIKVFALNMFSLLIIKLIGEFCVSISTILREIE